MKIFYSLYQLLGHNSRFRRDGALLKIHFPNEIVGFADCCPWIKGGDLPLKDQLSHLSQGRLTTLTKQSIRWALIDGSARAHSLNAFSQISIPPTHFLVTDWECTIPSDFRYCKLKLGYKSQEELKRLKTFLSEFPDKMLLRLDFNQRIDEATFMRYLKILTPFNHKLDCIEDPFTYLPGRWSNLQKNYHVRLACDYKSELYYENQLSHTFTVLKPAIQDCLNLAKKDMHELICTSYLDHPLGQMAAAYAAALLNKHHPDKLQTCGLSTHLNYQTNCYSEELKMQGDRLVPPKGTGLGFDHCLSKEKWCPLASL